MDSATDLRTRVPTTCAAAEAAGGSIGCEFWAVDLDNALELVAGTSHNYAGAQFAVVVSVPAHGGEAVDVAIWRNDGAGPVPVLLGPDDEPLDLSSIAAGTSRTFELRRRDVEGSTLGPLAYRITTSGPVAALQFNALDSESHSSDASLLLPTHALGTSHIVISAEQTLDGHRGFLTVVATHAVEPTTVIVTPTAETLTGTVRPGTASEAPLGPLTVGESFAFTLQAFDVLNLETNAVGADLTGTVIWSDEAVAVFGGSETANVPTTTTCILIDARSGMGVCEFAPEQSCSGPAQCPITCCADHLEHQLPPVTSWGSTFIATKTEERGDQIDVWRILAAEDGTLITLTPAQSGVSFQLLNAGQWVDVGSREDFAVRADEGKPVLVAQFLAGSGAGDSEVGDPSMMLVAPVSEHARRHTVWVPSVFDAHFWNLVAPSDADVEIDGEAVGKEHGPLIAGADGWRAYRFSDLEPGSHDVWTSEPSGLIAYGWDKYVSYGLAGSYGRTEQ